MSAQLDNLSLVPTVDQPIADQSATTTTSIRDAVLAQFKDAEVTITGLAEKYRDVAFDVATPKGMKEAVAARADLRDNGRLMVTKAETRIKGEVNDLKRVMGAEVERLVAIVQPVEKHVDDQIKAEEARKAVEKAERERIAAEKAEAHRAKIAKIRAAADNAKGIASERITNGIALVESLAFGDECENFLPEYEKAKAETLAAMRQHLADAQHREAAEAQRLENERIAAELAAQRAALEAQAAELKRQTEAAHAARVAITHGAVFSFPAPEPVVAPVAAGPIRDALARGIAAEFAPTTSLVAANNAAKAAIAETSEVQAAATECFAAIKEAEAAGAITPTQALRLAKSTAAVVAEDAVASAQAEPTLITTAQLGDLLGLPVQASLIESLGFTAIKLKKPGTYWDQAKAQAIGKALIAHIAKNIEAL